MNNNGKNQKRELQLKELKQTDSADASSQTLVPVMSFDAYFQKILKTKPGIMLHHKAPMRHFAEANGLKDAATEAEFEKVFSKY